ncbi:LuxR family transcriptional regulator [Pseudooceanicola sp.]|uniref:helix-turn-helix transcriptional regulator n=1 Tax=Pseudooceanicola sp. TaxID=1914328 RepID=UPI00261492CF|nr:LuxR family transcriptional regulator [Pseudooceanicola sp.]MDF1854691.1 autoinducer binding domain-containing protein [Pseudooceanicola sp.]
MKVLRISPISALRCAISNADSFAALQSAVLLARDHLGLDDLSYRWFNAPGKPVSVQTYSQAWIDWYLSTGQDRSNPIARSLIHEFETRNWKSLYLNDHMAREFLAQSSAHGLSPQALSVPIHGPHGEFAILSAHMECDDNAWAIFVADRRPDIELIARDFHMQARRLTAAEHNQPRALTPREIDVISLIARGLSRAKAAQRLNISEHTLRDHLRSARVKLGATSTIHAVARAVADGTVVV